MRHVALLVITMGSLATAFADIGNARAAGSVDAASTPRSVGADRPTLPYRFAVNHARGDCKYIARNSHPDVTVTTPSPPTEQELAGDSLYQFIVHHATVHYVSTATTRNLARWRGGMQSICPLTVGLDPGYNAFVTARLRALAAYVGAPVQSNPQCKDNVQILFTSKPKASNG